MSLYRKFRSTRAGIGVFPGEDLRTGLLPDIKLYTDHGEQRVQPARGDSDGVGGGVVTGKQRKTYPYKLMMTPYDKLKSMPNSKKYLKEGVTFEIIDKVAFAMTDNQSADRLQQARQSLFKTIDEREISTG